MLDIDRDDFNRMHLVGVDFKDQNLNGVEFIETTLDHCDLSAADIGEADFTYTKFINTRLPSNIPIRMDLEALNFTERVFFNNPKLLDMSSWYSCFAGEYIRLAGLSHLHNLYSRATLPWLLFSPHDEGFGYAERFLIDDRAMLQYIEERYLARNGGSRW